MFGRKTRISLSIACMVGWCLGCSDPVSPIQDMLNQGWEFQDTTGAWLPAEVPGCIHTDLLAHGQIPAPFLDRNEDEVQWVEHRDWTYRRPLPAPPTEGEWALEFGGLDTYAEVRVNGRIALRTDNMHRSWRIPASDLALTGMDTLTVQFLSPVRMGQEALDRSPWPIPASNEAKPIGTQTSAVTRKAMYHYGWDWGPRLVTSGFWKPVRWVRIDREMPTFRCAVESVDSVRAVVRVQWDAAVSGTRAALSLNGEGVPFQWDSLDARACRLEIPHPKLWWPAGMGGQPLYQLEIADAAGRSAVWRFGVRTLEWDRGEDAFGQAMRCVINGIPVQVRGANVIPPDFFPARAEPKWSRVVEDAVSAHMNMLRVWGGAHYADEALLDLCDEQGLLVWQDFMNACAMVPGDSLWRANFLAEAEEQVIRLRNRTSLAMWAGNNETEKAWRDWGWQDLYGLHGPDSVAVETAYRQVFEQKFPALVARLGGGEYQPSSPHHADPNRPRSSGDQHDWGVWFGKTGFEYYTHEAGRFASEFGLQSLPDRRTLEEAGVRDWSDPVLQFRQRCTMDWLEPGFDGWDMMQHYAGMYFADPDTLEVGTGLDRLGAWIWMTQLTQAEGLRQAIERHRCSGGRTAGSLYWQLDDVWPTVSWSTVDHAGRWKLAHHAVAHANQPVRVMPDRVAQSWRAFNDGDRPASGRVDWVHIDLTGDTLRSGALFLELAPFEAMDFLPMPWPEKGLLAGWSWTDDAGQILDSGWHCPVPVGELNWPVSEVSCVPTPDGVELVSAVPAAGVWMQSDRPGRFENNGFLMPAGQQRVRFWSPSGECADPGTVTVRHFGQLQMSKP